MTELERQIYLAKQINKAVQLTIEAANFDDDSAMEVADIYPEWTAGKEYKIDQIVKYGLNADEETQLYRVIQAHTSQADWTPDTTPSLYKAIGIGGDGIPVWTQPYGTSDAYQMGDRVHYPTADDPVYESTMDGNVWSPDTYPQGWKKI